MGIRLNLEVTDTEVVAELEKRAEGEERDRYALSALRIGVLSLRQASGQIDAAAIKEAGQTLVSDVEKTLTDRSKDLTSEIAAALTRYFDPDTGLVPQRIESLVKKDGELERMLRDHLGPEESVIARTLADHLGEGSSVFKMLSPTDTGGLRAQLAKTLEDALTEQREQVIGQFSLDDKGSALSRLITEINERQGKLGDDLREQIAGVVGEFSTDNKDSALNRLSRMLEDTSSKIGENLTLDDKNSALSLLKSSLEETFERLERKNTDFQKEVRDTLVAFNARKTEADRSTRHGVGFEEQLGDVIAREAQRLGDSYQHVGNNVGVIKNCKVGDFLTELGEGSATPGAKITWEAKEDLKYDISKARNEIEIARKNRDAQVGVFVFSSKTAPEIIEPLTRYGDDLVVIWDAENPESDVYLRAAYSVARALCVREVAKGSDLAEACGHILKATRAVEKQAKRLVEFKTKATTIKNNAEGIINDAGVMLEEFERQVAALDEQILALKTES